jgi:hypothetical protein
LGCAFAQGCYRGNVVIELHLGLRRVGVNRRRAQRRLKIRLSASEASPRLYQALNTLCAYAY